MVLQTKPRSASLIGRSVALGGSASYRRRTSNNKSTKRFYTQDRIKCDTYPFTTTTADVTLTGTEFLDQIFLF